MGIMFVNNAGWPISGAHFSVLLNLNQVSLEVNEVDSVPDPVMTNQ